MPKAKIKKKKKKNKSLGEKQRKLLKLLAQIAYSNCSSLSLIISKDIFKQT